MKTFKFYIMLKKVFLSTIVIFGLLVFTACSSDDDNEEIDDPTSGEPHYGISDIKFSGDISRSYSGNAVFTEYGMGNNTPDLISFEFMPEAGEDEEFELDISLINSNLDEIEETTYDFNWHPHTDPGVQAPHVFIDYNDNWIELYEDPYLSGDEGYFKVTSISDDIIEGKFVVFLEAYLDDSNEDLEIKAEGTFKAVNTENLSSVY